MFQHLRDAKARRKGEEVVESGFTLIELLVVIVVLGILAATVVFALSGVTGQSAVAACNSDAKTIDVAVQAYINSPDNQTQLGADVGWGPDQGTVQQGRSNDARRHFPGRSGQQQGVRHRPQWSPGYAPYRCCR